MKVTRTSLPDVVILEPKVFGDERGFFCESFNHQRFREAIGWSGAFMQDNHSRSARGVLRGLHYQIGKPQGKLVRVVRGSIYDIAVDLRRSSPTFGRSIGIELHEDRHQQIWIPPGFAHGFQATSEWADVIYKATDYYAPESERCLAWDDAALAIAWPLASPILSAKDRQGVSLADAETYP
jgi:dTDP-4-dehydrorhamnose 3,5-epimerase